MNSSSFRPMRRTRIRNSCDWNDSAATSTPRDRSCHPHNDSLYALSFSASITQSHEILLHNKNRCIEVSSVVGCLISFHILMGFGHDNAVALRWLVALCSSRHEVLNKMFECLVVVAGRRGLFCLQKAALFGQPWQSVVANTLDAFRSKAVGFIDWLDPFSHRSISSCTTFSAHHQTGLETQSCWGQPR